MKKLIFILICLLLAADYTAHDGAAIAAQQKPSENIIMTVRGPIQPSAFGKALVHEHVMCDFIGAAKTSRDRYEPDDIVETMLDFLQDVRGRGFTGFADCTPAWLGRDVEVLEQLAKLTGLHILANTGYYGAMDDKFVPSHAFTESAEQLAKRWVREWEQGIDGTNIKPGFIKTGVDGGALSEIDRKLVRAAAKTHLQTGLTIACHTGEGRAALAVLKNVRSEGVDPSALIIVHAGNIGDTKVHLQLAKAGAWVEYDGVGDESIEKHVGDQVLLSHDAGWYRVGEGESGKKKIRPYTTIADKLIPALKKAGVSEDELHMLFVDNPARAFTIQVRKK
jgi:phosphotriesterase-related protein